MMHPHIARLLAQAHVDEMLAAAERHRLRQLASGQQERATEGPSTALAQAGPPGEASHTVRSDGTGRGRRRRPWHPGRIAHVLARRYRHPERPRTDALTVGRAPERRLPRSQLSKVISSTTGASLLLIGAALLIACSSSPHEQTAPAVVPAVPASIPTTDTPPPSGFSAAGNTHLVDYSTNDGPDSTVVLTGAIGDTGQAESVHPDGSVDPDHASEWLNLLLDAHGRNVEGALFAIVQLARLTGDRSRDIDDSLRNRALDAVRSAHAPQSWQRLLLEVVSMETADQARAFGDTLPAGLAA